jgi:ribonucleoside-diphosphate reductase alpha chain
MRVIDPAWIGKKLRGLRDFPEPQGDFRAKVPGAERSEMQPATVAYIARLLIHRYAMLGILTTEGFPLKPLGMLEQEDVAPNVTVMTPLGKTCPECGTPALIRRDGCEFCTACGHIGSCG